MRLDRRQLAFPIVVTLTIGAALMPLDGWWGERTRELGRVARMPVLPFSDGANRLVDLVRPDPGPADEPMDAETRAKLVEERDRFHRLYQAEHRRVEELQEQLSQLQNLPAETLRFATTSLLAHVAKRAPTGRDGVVSLKLPGGRREPVPPGSIAVYAGVHLVGAAIEPSTPQVSTVLPIGNRETGYIRARFFEGDGERRRGDDLVQLEPTGDGAFMTTVRKTTGVARGDFARLDDDAWPRTAQMMVVGEVVEVRVDDAEPLRDIVTLRPVYRLDQLANVTLVLEDVEAVDGGQAP